MNVTCSAEPCPILLNASCVFYTGGNLVYTGIVTNDNLETALQKIDAKFGDAGLGYIFNNGLVQTSPGNPVQLGGSLIQNTTIASGGFNLTFTGELYTNKFVTIGGTSSQFVKGDGSLDGTSYQPVGNYITALTGDGTASGPGSAVFTLTSVSALYAGTWGSATTVPQFTIDSKGRVLSVTNVPISLPLPSATFVGDVYGSGSLASNITLTIANVLASPGTYGSGTQIPVITVNSKGQITNISQTPVLTSSGTVTSVSVTPGTGISASVTNPTTTPNITITNTAPDQIVTLNPGTGIGISGTYPNFTITNTSPSSGGTVTNVTASSPLASSGGTTPNITIQQASGLQDGYLSSADWTTFNNKQSAITLTTLGTSGAATFIANTLNIPQYQAALTNPVTGTGTTNYLSKFTGTSSIGDSQIFDNGSQIDLLNSTRPVLSVLNTGLSVNSVSALNDADSYRLRFNAIGSSGNAQSADIILDGNGAANGAAFIIRNNNGSVNLTPSNNDINLNATNPQLYATTGGIRFTNNSTSQGFLFGNYNTQSSGALFQVQNTYTNVGVTYPFTVFANGNVLLGTTTQTDAGYKLDVVGTTRLNGNSTVNGTLGVGTASPNASSLVDMTSTARGLLIPRMTTAQINAIASPAQGLLAYSTDENFLYYYDTTWGWVSDNLFYKKKYEDEALAPFLSSATVAGSGFLLASTTGGTFAWVNALRNGASRMSTSTSATARVSWVSDASTANGFGNAIGRIYFETSVNIATLSTAGEAYSLAIGFSANTTVPTLTNGSHFLYDTQGVATGAAASTNWQVGNAALGVRSYTTTGITVAAATYYKLGIMINPNATQIDYYINDTLVKSETTNIPLTLGGVYLLLLKSNGTTARTVDIDYVYYRIKFTTPKP